MMCELNPNLVNLVLFRLQYHQCWQKWKTTILNQDNDINKTLSRNKSLEPFIKKDNNSIWPQKMRMKRK